MFESVHGRNPSQRSGSTFLWYSVSLNVVQGGSSFMCVWMKSLRVTIQMKATEQYFLHSFKRPQIFVSV